MIGMVFGIMAVVVLVAAATLFGLYLGLEASYLDGYEDGWYER